MRFPIVLSLVCVLVTSGFSQDILRMNKGPQKNGKVIYNDSYITVLQSINGKTDTLVTSDIKSIIYGEGKPDFGNRSSGDCKWFRNEIDEFTGQSIRVLQKEVLFKSDGNSYPKPKDAKMAYLTCEIALADLDGRMPSI